MEYLGGVIGTTPFLQKVVEKVKIWSEEVKKLSFITESEPHAAYASFIHGVSARWTYFAHVIDFRCLSAGSQSFAPLENTIWSKFIPALTGSHQLGDLDQRLLTPLIRLGWLGLLNPTHSLADHYSISVSSCSPLINCFFLLTLSSILCHAWKNNARLNLICHRRD